MAQDAGGSYEVKMCSLPPGDRKAKRNSIVQKGNEAEGRGVHSTLCWVVRKAWSATQTWGEAFDVQKGEKHARQRALLVQGRIPARDSASLTLRTEFGFCHPFFLPSLSLPFPLSSFLLFPSSLSLSPSLSPSLPSFFFILMTLTIIFVSPYQI